MSVFLEKKYTFKNIIFTIKTPNTMKYSSWCMLFLFCVYKIQKKYIWKYSNYKLLLLYHVNLGSGTRQRVIYLFFILYLTYIYVDVKTVIWYYSTFYNIIHAVAVVGKMHKVIFQAFFFVMSFNVKTHIFQFFFRYSHVHVIHLIYMI